MSLCSLNPMTPFSEMDFILLFFSVCFITSGAVVDFIFSNVFYSYTTNIPHVSRLEVHSSVCRFCRCFSSCFMLHIQKLQMFVS